MDDAKADSKDQAYEVNDEERTELQNGQEKMNVAEEYGNNPPEDADALHNTDTFESPPGQMTTEQIIDQSAWDEHEKVERADPTNPE